MFLAYTFWVCSFLFNFQETQQTGFNPSNLEALQKHCSTNGIAVYYEKDGIVIHANKTVNEVFIFPIKSRYIWKVWQSQSDNNIFKLSSSVWNRRTGNIKNNKKAEVIIDILNLEVYDKQSQKKYSLSFDHSKKALVEIK